MSTISRVLLFAPLVATLLSACALFQPPGELDLTLSKPSKAAAYTLAIAPARGGVAVNQMHSWTIRVRNPAGEPVKGAHITFDGGMPQHMHGFPTKPRVTEETEAGSYRLDGVKFSMRGWWEMKFHINGAGGTDSVTFNTVITDAGLATTALDYK